MKKFISLALVLMAVKLAAQPADDVVLRAMQDELQRNLQELQAPGFDKPFFIMYGMLDSRQVAISATMGALLDSEISHGRHRTTTRVLVGDYGFNDESLEDDLTSGPTPMELDLPVSDDYEGIRRSYWSVTDNVYREAARHYKAHQESLKESGKSIKDVVHREFAKSQPVRIIKTMPPFALNKASWEDRMRKLSEIFKGKEGVISAMVMFLFNEGHTYLVSSEGTMIKVPFQSATLAVFVEGRSSQGAPVVEQLVFSTRRPDQLPDDKLLADQIAALLVNLRKVAPSGLEETYTGPVLYLGPSVAHAFSRGLTGREGLAASDMIPTSRGFSFEEENTDMDSRLGRTILHESITVKAKPKMTTFQGVDLLGSFEVDPEGIVPADELVLVEKGVLRNLMNNRTITHKTQRANGLGRGPGVLEITTTMNDSEASLRKKLIQAAKKEGLEYAVIVRGSPLMAIGPTNVYRINVADGKETLVHNAMVRERGSRTFRRILGASGTYAAYNLGFMAGNMEFGPGDGPAASFIVPTALLLEEVEIQTFRMPRQKEKEYVPSPLVKP